jgi:hypothetical protein
MDPWNIAANGKAVESNVVAENLRGPQSRWWRTAGEMSGLPGNDSAPGKPWWNESGLPAFGEHMSTDPSSWLGIAMFKQAIAGQGPPLHVANFEGNLTVPPNKLIETLVETMQLRPVRFAYGRLGIKKILFSSDASMLALGFDDGGRYADVSIASTHEDLFKKVAKLCAGILTHDNPKEGFVYALAKGMAGYNLTRIGAAGTPLERGNYNPQVLANYDHVVADLKAESPCGRLIIMAGEPGTGKTFLVRSLLSDIPKAAFVVVPPHLVKELGSPELLPALASARGDGLTGPMALIIEDADKVLVQRDAGDMAAISSLLNLGDGILGSVLDVRIIATTNAGALEMDPATRRKGRLCSYIDVGPVEPEQAETIVHRLTGSNKRPAKRVTLAEVYSHARSIGWTPPPKVRPPNPWEKSYIL